MRLRAWRYWLQAVLATIGVAAAMGLAVAVCYVHNLRVDLSPGSRFTLSDHALKVLRALDQPLKITAFIRTEDPRNPILKDLLWQAAHETTYIDYTVLDINKNPALATQLGVAAYGAVVVESKTQRRDFSNPSETQLVSAILRVTQPPKTVVAVTGHGECDLQSSARRNGCSAMRTAISQEFYDIRPMTLVGGRRIPSELSVLLIVGPRSDFLDEELAALRDYLDRGGKLLLLIDPYQAPKLVALMAEYGLAIGDDVVLDPENRLAGGEFTSLVVRERNDQQLLTRTLESPPLFSGVRSVIGRSDPETGRDAAYLLGTGPTSWASYDRGVLKGTSEPRFVAGRDRNGPIRVGAEVTEPAPRPEDPNSGARTRIIAYGDSDFVTNRFLDYLGNKDLLLNSLNWLAQEDTLLAARPQLRKPAVNQLFISEAQAATVFTRSVIVLPAVFIGVGVLMLAWRRLAP